MLFITFIYILKILIIVVPLLISVAYFTLAERKIMGSIQRRRGPNVVGYLGLLQPLADGLKLFVKETILPTAANTGIFLLAPLLTFILSLMGWAVIPFGEGLVLSDINLGVLYLFAVSSLSVYATTRSTLVARPSLIWAMQATMKVKVELGKTHCRNTAIGANSAKIPSAWPASPW